jgi:hypothetical protein
MAKSHLELVPPTEVNRTVAPVRRPNAELRTREHLTPGEVEALVEAAKANRHGHRDATMILVPSGTGCAPPRPVTCAGARSTSMAPSCTYDGSRTARPAPIHCTVTNSGPCAGSSGRARRRRLSSSASGDPRSRRRASPGSSNGWRPAAGLERRTRGAGCRRHRGILTCWCRLSRHPAPPTGVEAAELAPPVRARLGRLGNPRRCGGPRPLRPVRTMAPFGSVPLF